MARQITEAPGEGRRQLVIRLTVVAALLIIIFGWIWWSAVLQNPNRVFWGMISNNLSTSGVTRHIVENSSGQQLDEYVQLQLGASNFAHAETTLTQNGTVIKTETIGTPNADYTRYTGVTTTSKGSSGQPLNFGKVVNVWAKNPVESTGQNSDSLQHLFGQTLLGVVPMGNLPDDERAQLIDQIKNYSAFVPDLSTVAHKTIAGHRALVYKVSIQPVGYAAVMQSFAKDLGQPALAEFDPNNYQGAPTVSLNFAVDAVSHQLIQISYPNANHTETYSGYGIQSSVTLPTATVTPAKLQQLIGEVK